MGVRLSVALCPTSTKNGCLSSSHFLAAWESQPGSASANFPCWNRNWHTTYLKGSHFKLFWKHTTCTIEEVRHLEVVDSKQIVFFAPPLQRSAQVQNLYDSNIVIVNGSTQLRLFISAINCGQSTGQKCIK